MIIDCKNIDYENLNKILKDNTGNIILNNVLGQRYIACGTNNLDVTVNGIPGNALGAYLNGSTVRVMGNSEDQLGDTMNCGKIIVHGNAGDTTGYAMRGGKIYILKDSGYRLGIHMKEYNEKKPLIIIGGTAGAFLGEYQAGGTIVLLNLENKDEPLGLYPSRGFHHGKLYIRGKFDKTLFSNSVSINKAKVSDIEEIIPYLEEFSDDFGIDLKNILNEEFSVITPNTENIYKVSYVGN